MKKENNKEDIDSRGDFIDKKKPINLRKEKTVLDTTMIMEKGKEKGGYMTPSSTPIFLVKSIFETAGTKRDVLVNKNIDLNTNTDYYGKTTYSYSKNKDNYQIQILNKEEILTRQDRNTRKIFNFLLQKENSNGLSEDNKIYFHLSELIDRGIYKNKDTAYRGLKGIYPKLMSILIEGNAYKGKKEFKSRLTPFIKEAERSYNTCWVEVSPELFVLLKQYFTVLPVWSDRLNSRAYSLVDCIYITARTNLMKRKTKGVFNIKLRTLSNWLSLPDPTTTTKHKQLISDPILQAIEEIEDTQREFRPNKENIPLMITPYYNIDFSDINEFLEGYLEISLDEETTKYFEASCKKYEKKITDNIKKVQAFKSKTK